jgi:eukaryotic-like serine/threonine-protein kinase
MEQDREQILDLIVEWEQAKADGRDLAPEELCRGCPQLLSGFRRQVEKLDEVAWLDDPVMAGTPMPSGNSPSWSDTELPRLLAGRYRLDALVGRGGFGRVYRGYDTWLERVVAVKMPRVDRAVSDGEVDECRIEARKVARLRHPNIVPVHDVGREGSSCFIVGEWVEGMNLAARLHAGPLDFRESAQIVAEIADALAHAHRAGFVHRDIKPANILIDSLGRAYLTDFGIAVIEEDLHRSVVAAGTLPYMAPEQLDEVRGPVDHRTDIYAFGVLLYELLTNRRPFQAGSPIALREQILHADAPAPRSLDPNVPEPLERICLRCLAKKPDARYPDADAAVEDLRAFLEAPPQRDPNRDILNA